MSNSFDQMEFAARLQYELQCKPYIAASHASRLMQYGRTIQRLNELACNVGLTEAQEKTRGRKAEAIRDYVSSELGGNFSVFINGDPRGAALKLGVPSKACDDMGGDGICVPD